MGAVNGPTAGHVFISYVREDSRSVDHLQQVLEAAGVSVWRDVADIWPGQDWRARIRAAINDDALAFVACFSRASVERKTSYQNEELVLAIDQLRRRQPDDPWLIPVRFDACDIPYRDIGAGRTLGSIQRADLFGDRAREETERLVASIQWILGCNPRVSSAALPDQAALDRAEVVESSGLHPPLAGAQKAWDRVSVAARLAHLAVDAFDFEPNIYARPDLQDPSARLWHRAQRCLLLQLKVKYIAMVCDEELHLGLRRSEPAVLASDVPGDITAAADLIDRFAEDAENAFGAFSFVIAEAIEERDLFGQCIGDLLEDLRPGDADHWKLVSRVIRSYGPYQLSLVYAPIEDEVAVLDVLDWLRAELSDRQAAELKITDWIVVTTRRLYEIATAIWQKLPPDPPWPGVNYDGSMKTVGQAVARIWPHDDAYRDTRSWFPADHPWWPFHLPGKPQILREYKLPPGRVACLLYLPWGSAVVLVVMTHGQVHIFDASKEQAVRSQATGLTPELIRYTRFGVMIEGHPALPQDSPWRRWLILGEDGSSLAGQRVPPRRGTPIAEGLVPQPGRRGIPLTMAQIAEHYAYQHQLPPIEAYVFEREPAESALPQAEFNSRGWLVHGQKHRDLTVGLDSANSRLVVRSGMLQSQQSFLVPPGVSRCDVSSDYRTLALAGDGHLYIYGQANGR
jgi:TIR domain